jgi:plastocyanin/regulation of enolase protein 1 (concanavalin A-like superfamily)
MTRILSFRPNARASKENLFKRLWSYFKSLDRFTRLFIIAYVLIGLITPIIVANLQIFNPRAAGVGAAVPGTLTLKPNLETIGVYQNYSGDDGDATAYVEWKKHSDTTWKRGMNLVKGSTFANQFRGFVIKTDEDTDYDVRVTIVDPDETGPQPQVIGTAHTRTSNPPSTGRTVNVSTQAQFTSALSGAQAGDTIIVAPGTYSGVSVTKSGTASNWITIKGSDLNNKPQITSGTEGFWVTGSYIKISGFNVSNVGYGFLVGPDSNDGTATPHDVIVEKNDISNVGTAQGFEGSVVIGYNGSNLHTGIGWITVQDNNITVTKGEAEAGTIHDTRAPTGSNVIRRNKVVFTYNNTSTHGTDCFGSGSNFQPGDGIGENSDVNDNICLDATDDGVELDGDIQNVRVWGNFFSGSMAGTSVTPVAIGPAFFFRNVIIKLSTGWPPSAPDCYFIKQGQDSQGMSYFYHNTIYSPDNTCPSGKMSGPASGDSPRTANIFMRNNIINVYNRAYSYEKFDQADTNYNLLEDTDKTDGVFAKFNGSSYGSFSSYVSGSGQDRNSIEGTALFANPLPANPTFTSFQLAPNSPGVDRGVALPGFNDTDSPWPSSGAAPDMGAFEVAGPALPTATPGGTTPTSAPTAVPTNVPTPTRTPTPTPTRVPTAIPTPTPTGGQGGPPTATPVPTAIQDSPTPPAGLGIITGNVYIDANNNGSKDTGEVGQAGATVLVTGAAWGSPVIASGITNSSGNYSISGFASGAYTVMVDAPAGYAASTTTDNAVAVTLGPTATVNFGVYQLPAPNTTLPPAPTPAANAPFVFTASGDIRSTIDTNLSLDQIRAQNSNFYIALGDLSYNDIAQETKWCDYVKSRVGDTFPVELIAGNHDQDADLDHINEFRQCLPDRIGNIVGDYAKQYYFDYNNLARFILVSGNIALDGEDYAYNVGTPRYNWVSQAIDDARARGIPWVIVGLHRPCLSAGTYPCVHDPNAAGGGGMGTDLFNLLVNKKVDLILNAHVHNYQRSKQLSLGSTCSQITDTAYNANCVVDNGADNTYTKGLGTVNLIMGMTYGSRFRNMASIDTSDPDSNYFASMMGFNLTPRNGIGKFTVSANQIRFDFVPSTNTSTFTDSFVINATGLTATPAPTRVNTPIPTAIPTPTPTGGQGGPTDTPVPTVVPTSVPVFTISGTVYVDSNGNGAKDTGEPGFSGATVALSGNGNSTTNASGTYTFSNITAGSYPVTLTLPSGYVATTTNPVLVIVGPNATVNFGIVPTATATAIPTVTIAPTPIPGNGATVPGQLELAATYENISVYANFSNDDGDNSAIMEYRPHGTSAWIRGMDLVVDRRANLSQTGGCNGGNKLAEERSETGWCDNNPFKNQWRGSILGLQPNADYDVRVTFSDPDGVSGTNPVVGSISTRDDNPPSGNGATYYVATTGNDANAGTDAAPFRTIQKAVSIVNPGDTVLVKAGTYTGSLLFTRSGAANAYITIKNYQNDNVILSGTNPTVKASYLIISGFEITGGTYGFYFRDDDFEQPGNAASNVIIENNNIHDINLVVGNTAMIWVGNLERWMAHKNIKNITIQNNTITQTVNNQTASIVLQGVYEGGHVIRNNHINHTYNAGSSHGADCWAGSPNFYPEGGLEKDTDVYNNTCTNATDDAYELDGLSMNVRVYNNYISNAMTGGSMTPVFVGPAYVYRNVINGVRVTWDTGCTGIKTGESGTGYTFFYHNTFEIPSCPGQTNFSGMADYSSGNAQSNFFFKNNIMRVGGNIVDGVGTSGMTNNLFSGSGIPSGNTTGTATYVDAANKDFRLQPNSAGINVGQVITGFNDANSAWPYNGSAPDAGAYELGSGGRDVTPPDITMTAPANGARVTGVVTVSANATDDTGVTRVQFLLDGANLGGSDTAAPYSIQWDTNLTPNGSHVLSAVAFDAAGNQGTPLQTVTVTVEGTDITPPTISNISVPTLIAHDATITWTTNEPSSSQVEYGTTTSYGSSSQNDLTLITVHSISLSNLNPTTLYHYRVKSQDAKGNLATSADATFTTPAIEPFPAGWTPADVGSTGVAGSATYYNGTFTVNGSGTDIFGTADAFHFVYQQLTGDGSITARVVTEENTNQFAKAGVMIRSSLAANSQMAVSLAYPPSSGLAYQYRSTAGGSVVDTPGRNTSVGAPVWVRVTRSGNTLSGYFSTDGQGWNPQGSQTISMGSTVYVGLVVSAHDNTTLNTSTFDNVTVSGVGGPTNQPTPTPVFSITGNVFIDSNGNGVKDSGETNSTGRTLTLSGQSSGTTTTDASGNYTFSNRVSGNYTVTLTVPSGFTATTTNPRSISVGPNATVNFGIVSIPTATAIPTVTQIPTAIPTPTQMPANAVSIQNLSFVPQTLTVSMGTRVTWINNDTTTHTTTSDTGVWDSSILNPTQSFSFTFSAPGTYTYHCAVHPSMTGTIQVIDTPTPTPTRIPTVVPTNTVVPTPTRIPTGVPTPTRVPTLVPTATTIPTGVPTTIPTQIATVIPTATSIPTVVPTVPQTFSITGTVYKDLNGNGAKDPTDTGYEGASLVLAGTSNKTIKTNESGNYILDNLPAGVYSITLLTPEGYSVATSNPVLVILGPDATVNFGIVPQTPPAISIMPTPGGTTILVILRIEGATASTKTATITFVNTTTGVSLPPVNVTFTKIGTNDYRGIITPPPSGTYGILLKIPGFLQDKTQFSYTNGGLGIDIRAKSIASGDVNNDNQINGLDLGRAIEQYGSSSPESDLNNDGVVDAFDMGLIIQNYRKRGDK